MKVRDGVIGCSCRDKRERDTLPMQSSALIVAHSSPSRKLAPDDHLDRRIPAFGSASQAIPQRDAGRSISTGALAVDQLEEARPDRGRRTIAMEIDRVVADAAREQPGVRPPAARHGLHVAEIEQRNGVSTCSKSSESTGRLLPVLLSASGSRMSDMVLRCDQRMRNRRPVPRRIGAPPTRASNFIKVR